MGSPVASSSSRGAPVDDASLRSVCYPTPERLVDEIERGCVDRVLANQGERVSNAPAVAA